MESRIENVEIEMQKFMGDVGVMEEKMTVVEQKVDKMVGDIGSIFDCLKEIQKNVGKRPEEDDSNRKEREEFSGLNNSRRTENPPLIQNINTHHLQNSPPQFSNTLQTPPFQNPFPPQFQNIPTPHPHNAQQPPFQNPSPFYQHHTPPPFQHTRPPPLPNPPFHQPQPPSYGEPMKTEWLHRKMELPIFLGDDPYGWLFRVDRYVHLNGIPDDSILEAVAICLEGEALNWFQWRETWSPLTTWPAFQRVVLR